MKPPLSDGDVIVAIRANHLQANIGAHELSGHDIEWDKATVDPGGTIFGPGPYLKVPVWADGERMVRRVYAPARLRRQLAARWQRNALGPGPLVRKALGRKAGA